MSPLNTNSGKHPEQKPSHRQAEKNKPNSCKTRSCRAVAQQVALVFRTPETVCHECSHDIAMHVQRVCHGFAPEHLGRRQQTFEGQGDHDQWNSDLKCSGAVISLAQSESAQNPDNDWHPERNTDQVIQVILCDFRTEMEAGREQESQHLARSHPDRDSSPYQFPRLREHRRGPDFPYENRSQ